MMATTIDYIIRAAMADAGFTIQQARPLSIGQIQMTSSTLHQNDTS